MDAPEDERQRYQAYVEQLNAVEGELEQAQQRAAALRKIVEGYTELYPELDLRPREVSAAAPPSDERPKRRVVRKVPTGKRAVAVVLQKADELLTVGEIMEELETRGTAPASEEALRTTLNRMFKNDGTVEKGEKDGRLAYQWNN